MQRPYSLKSPAELWICVTRSNNHVQMRLDCGFLSVPGMPVSQIPMKTRNPIDCEDRAQKALGRTESNSDEQEQAQSATASPAVRISNRVWYRFHANKTYHPRGEVSICDRAVSYIAPPYQ